MAELEGVPEAAIREFSTRRQSLVEHMEARGTEGFAAAESPRSRRASARSRSTSPRLREDWRHAPPSTDSDVASCERSLVLPAPHEPSSWTTSPGSGSGARA